MNQTDASTPTPAKGPWSHRFLLGLFTIALGVLVWWLLGFFLDDIENLRGPDFAALRNERLDPALTAEEASVTQELAAVDRDITDRTAEQTLLRDSTDNSQRTMTQLLEFQRLSLDKNVTPSREEQQALAESERLFLANQDKYQQLNDQLAGLHTRRRELLNKRLDVESRMSTALIPIHAEYERQRQRHNLLVGAAKLGLLVPLLLVAVWLFVRYRLGLYARLVYAFGAAVLVRTGFVMHEFFPRWFFKYVMILTSLAVVVAILLHLLRMIARPRRDWLLKQYREAYEVFACPVCAYPIRRGPLRYAYWTRSSVKKLVVAISPAEVQEEAYICPACSTALYEKCERCGGVRASLLPSCQNCGHEKPAAAATNAT